MNTYRVTFLVDADEEPDPHEALMAIGGYDVEIDETSPVEVPRAEMKAKPKRPA